MVYWSVPKGPKGPLFRPFKYFNRATPEKYGGSLLKNLLAESPELFITIVTCVAALGWVGYMASNYEDADFRKVPYKHHYIVIRPTDPLMSHVRENAQHYLNADGTPKYTKDIY